ncbi:MAG: hypothetical protein ACI3XM_06795 [Eubacteriales bacterium]
MKPTDCLFSRIGYRASFNQENAMKIIRFLIFVLSFACLLLSACDSAPQPADSAASPGSDHTAYRSEFISLPTEDMAGETITYFGTESVLSNAAGRMTYASACAGDRLILFCYPTEHPYNHKPTYLSVDLNTQAFTFVPVDARIDENGCFTQNVEDAYLQYTFDDGEVLRRERYRYEEIYGFSVNEAGQLAILYQYAETVLKEDFDPDEVRTYTMPDGSVSVSRPSPFRSVRHYRLALYQPDGSLCYETDIDSDVQDDSMQRSKLPILLAEDGSVCFLFADTTVILLNPDGTLRAEYPLPTGNIYKTSLQKTPDGTCYLVYPDDESMVFQYSQIDFAAPELKAPTALPDVPFSESVFIGGNGGYYVSDDITLEYRYPGTDAETLFDFAGVSLIGADIDSFYVRDDRRFLAVSRDPLTQEPQLVHIFVPDDGVPAKTEIVVACADYHDNSIRTLQTAVSLFNRKSDAYQVTVVYYSAEKTGVFSVNQQIANDMMNGKQIDLILFHRDVTMEYFDNLGILGDWYPLMDADETYSRGAFLPCVLNAYETADGKLPVLTTDFGLTTLAGSAALLGEKENWTYSECRDFIQTLAWDQILLQLDKEKGNAESDAMLVLQSFLPMVLDDYIDTENGTCSFDSESFQTFLTLCSEVLINHEAAAYKESQGLFELLYESNGFLHEYRNGNTVLFNQCENLYNGAFSITKPSDVLNILDNFFKGQESVTFIGYPMPDGSAENGTAVTPWVQFGLTASAAHTDGAWAFIKGYLDYQAESADDLSYLPCSYEGLETALSDYERCVYLMDGRPWVSATENTFLAELPDMYFYANESVRPILTALLETTTRRYSGRTALMNIIYEEAPYFFDGIQSLEDVTKRIQSRAGIYLSEQQ